MSRIMTALAPALPFLLPPASSAKRDFTSGFRHEELCITQPEHTRRLMLPVNRTMRKIEEISRTG
jgi:hypothetical protein